MSETARIDGAILVIAPQPFFQNRGTPIAVRLLVEELARLGIEVHLLVFHEGEDVLLPGVRLHRIPSVLGIKNIPPSLSIKKVICDAFMVFKAIQLHRHHRFIAVHAVEESVFIAMLLKLLFGTPYIYDMDSSLALQIIEKFPLLKPIGKGLQYCERLAVRGSFGVVAVCEALEVIARKYAPEKLIVRLEDISLLGTSPPSDEILRERYGISGQIMLYVGNLEPYQGIDLLFSSFQLALRQGCRGNLVIIGGTPETIEAYKKVAGGLGISDRTIFCGPRPVELLGHYLAQADILLSPRTKGNNTPMKLYSYLDSGKVVLATNLPTHTQVLTESYACLVEPEEQSMAAGMVKLLSDPVLCAKLGQEGRRMAQEKYSLAAFRSKLEDFYRRVFSALQPPAVHNQPTVES